MDYYLAELEKVKPFTSKYPVKIKVYANGNGEDTNYIDLNGESADAIIQWLLENYKDIPSTY